MYTAIDKDDFTVKVGIRLSVLLSNNYFNDNIVDALVNDALTKEYSNYDINGFYFEGLKVEVAPEQKQSDIVTLNCIGTFITMEDTL